MSVHLTLHLINSKIHRFCTRLRDSPREAEGFLKVPGWKECQVLVPSALLPDVCEVPTVRLNLSRDITPNRGRLVKGGTHLAQLKNREKRGLIRQGKQLLHENKLTEANM